MNDKEQRYYDPQLLNKVFAVSSMIFLASLIGMFWYDYDREWRGYQSEFHKIDIRLAETRLREEKDRLAADSEFIRLSSELKAELTNQETKSTEIDRLNAELHTLMKARDAAREKLDFEDAEYDALKYEFEQARNAGAGRADRLHEDLLKSNLAVEEKQIAVEKFDAEVAAKRMELGSNTAKATDLKRKLEKLTRKHDLLTRKLKRLNPKRMSRLTRIGEKVRNLPLMDMLNPRYNVREHQLIINGITDDMIFTRVPKVDRCMACHLGIDKQGFENEKNPYRTHPNLDLYVDTWSPHPVKEFGCTSCHNGRGRGTSFRTAAHMPMTKKQKKEWEERHDWHRLHHWDTPMYPARYTQAGCFKCHSYETEIRGAEELNVGLALIRKAGCNGCHLIEKFKDDFRIGPDLRHIRSKTTEEWAFRWINDPKAFREHTWMPSFFNQSNNSDIKDRTDQEIRAIVHYLFTKSADYKMSHRAKTAGGDAGKGKELVMSLGCMACHMIENEAYSEKLTLQAFRRQHGPRLVGLGSKTSAAWIFDRLKNPWAYDPNARMPDLRLSDQEASDITAYLMSLKNDEFMKTPVPGIDEEVLNTIARDQMTKFMSHSDAENKIKSMSVSQKLLYTGERLVRRYGCFGCHNIPGFENDTPIGTELTEEGSKSVAQLDFGLQHDIEHVNYVWFEQKLKNPRIFDHGLEKVPNERLIMPNFGFTQHEIEVIVTALLAFTKPDPGLKKIKPRTMKNMLVEDGQKLIRRLNCKGCHVIDGTGGAVKEPLAAWLQTYGESSEPDKTGEEEEEDGWGEEEEEEVDIEGLVSAYSPPGLNGEGAKVQPEWLFHFLDRPETVRPWLNVRMPGYGLNGSELNTLVKYFNYLDDQEFPFEPGVVVDRNSEEFRVAERLFSPKVMNCVSCHVVGGKPPEGKSPSEMAPDLAMTKRRLKPAWIVEWLKDPQAITPGTKMPLYWPEGEKSPMPGLGRDSAVQRKAICDYLFTLPD